MTDSNVESIVAMRNARGKLETVRIPRNLIHTPSIAAVAIGLLLTGVLSWVAYTANQRNDQRLLALQTKETASLLGAVVTIIQTPLASAAAIAEATHGDVGAFRNYITPDVGKGHIFVSASLWKIQTTSLVLKAVVGVAPLLSAKPTTFRTTFSGGIRRPGLDVAGILGGTEARLLYTFTPGTDRPSFLVAASTALPPDRVAPTNAGSVSSSLNFALYLGRSTKRSTLLESNVRHPLSGQIESTVVPFGDSGLTLIASANRQLGGALSEDVWWLVAIVGAMMTLGAAVMSERLERSRLKAQVVANENGRLYAQQRGVAETLQHTLLPQELPEFQGLELAHRYIPGVEGLDIGGDWYDVLRLHNNRLLFVVGDVSGRGLQAASFMAALRFAISAYALQGDPPATIFDKLGEVLNISRDHHFATVFCALIDSESGQVTMANAGHPSGLLHTAHGTHFIESSVGPPIGVGSSTGYENTTIQLESGAVLLAFTDGLFERRGESLDNGLQRIRDFVSASDPNVSVDELIGDLIKELVPEGPSDDIALLGLKWTSSALDKSNALAMET